MSRSNHVFLAAALLTGCTAAPTVPDVKFGETYVGTSGPATITLESMGTLPSTPIAGWLNRAEADNAVARFGAKKRGVPKFEVSPVLVTFDAQKKDENPPARYEWRNDALVLCMLTVNFGTQKGSDRQVLIFDYNTCASMARAGQGASSNR
jgi:hypothetical protein